jgi:hypothetical protein
MRVIIAKSKKAHAGQRVRFHVSLPKGLTNAYVEVFSAVGDYEPSPHVQMFKANAKENGKPMMLGATSLRLSPARKVLWMDIISDETCRFFLMQDTDVRGELTAKGKIEVYGKFKEFVAYAIRWFGRNR